MYELLFVKPWPFWAAGLGIGLFVTALAWLIGRTLGVSSGYADACQLSSPGDKWKLVLVLGLPLGGLLSAWLSGQLQATWTLGLFDSRISEAPLIKAPILFLGGLLLGLGARRAGGCTSGHAIVGTAQLAPASLITTTGMMLGGLITTQLILRLGALS